MGHKFTIKNKTDYKEFLTKREKDSLITGNLYHLEAYYLYDENHKYIAELKHYQLKWFVTMSQYREMRINELLDESSL